MTTDANLKKRSSALRLFSTPSTTTATLLCSETYQRNKTFTFYSQLATNTYHISQPAPAVQILLCKPALPVAQTLALFSEDLGWHRNLHAHTYGLLHSFSGRLIQKRPSLLKSAIINRATSFRIIFGQYNQKCSTFMETSQQQESGQPSWMLLVIFPVFYKQDHHSKFGLIERYWNLG